VNERRAQEQLVRQPGPPSANETELSGRSTADLLALYGSILNVLRERGITRSENPPTGDYAELLAARAFGLTLTTKSSSALDGTDSSGVAYQVKGRRMTRWNGSRQLSAIRGLDAPTQPFEFLLGILFRADYTIMRAALIPFDQVLPRATFQPHVNGWRFMLNDIVWSLDGVRDVSEEIRLATLADG
jgi:hypothetical protein